MVASEAEKFRISFSRSNLLLILFLFLSLSHRISFPLAPNFPSSFTLPSLCLKTHQIKIIQRKTSTYQLIKQIAGGKVVKNGNAKKSGLDSQRSTATMTASGTAGANQASLATLSRNNTLTSCEDVSSFIARAFCIRQKPFAPKGLGVISLQFSGKLLGNGPGVQGLGV